MIIISPEKKKINILMQISLKKYAELRRLLLDNDNVLFSLVGKPRKVQ